jgi:hypothetical protein
VVEYVDMSELLMSARDIIPLEDLVPQEPTFRELFFAVQEDPDIEADDYRMIADSVAKALRGKVGTVIFVREPTGPNIYHISYYGPDYLQYVDHSDSETLELKMSRRV